MTERLPHSSSVAAGGAPSPRKPCTSSTRTRREKSVEHRDGIEVDAVGHAEASQHGRELLGIVVRAQHVGVRPFALHARGLLLRLVGRRGPQPRGQEDPLAREHREGRGQREVGVAGADALALQRAQHAAVVVRRRVRRRSGVTTCPSTLRREQHGQERQPRPAHARATRPRSHTTPRWTAVAAMTGSRYRGRRRPRRTRSPRRARRRRRGAAAAAAPGDGRPRAHRRPAISRPRRTRKATRAAGMQEAGGHAHGASADARATDGRGLTPARTGSDVSACGGRGTARPRPARAGRGRRGQDVAAGPAVPQVPEEHGQRAHDQARQHPAPAARASGAAAQRQGDAPRRPRRRARPAAARRPPRAAGPPPARAAARAARARPAGAARSEGEGRPPSASTSTYWPTEFSEKTVRNFGPRAR